MTGSNTQIQDTREPVRGPRRRERREAAAILLGSFFALTVACHPVLHTPPAPRPINVEECHALATTIRALVAKAEIGKRPAANYHEALEGIDRFQRLDCERAGDPDSSSVAANFDLIAEELSSFVRSSHELAEYFLQAGDLLEAFEQLAWIVTIDPTDQRSQKQLDAVLFLLELNLPPTRRGGNLFSRQCCVRGFDGHRSETHRPHFEISSTAVPSIATGDMIRIGRLTYDVYAPTGVLKWDLHFSLDDRFRSRLARSLGLHNAELE